MNIQELIDELQKVEDKSLTVKVRDNEFCYLNDIDYLDVRETELVIGGY